MNCFLQQLVIPLGSILSCWCWIDQQLNDLLLLSSTFPSYLLNDSCLCLLELDYFMLLLYSIFTGLASLSPLTLPINYIIALSSQAHSLSRQASRICRQKNAQALRTCAPTNYAWCAWQAATKPSKIACGRLGREINSGWNWAAIKNGWPLISTISTKRPSGLRPEKVKPAAAKRSR